MGDTSIHTEILSSYIKQFGLNFVRCEQGLKVKYHSIVTNGHFLTQLTFLARNPVRLERVP